jgi:Tfp pilus assembly protein PilF
LSGFGCAQLTTNTRADRDRGIKLYNDGQYADAAGAFRETIRHTPADLQSHLYLAQSLDHMGAYEQAVEQYRTTLKIMENSLEGRDDRPLRLKTLNQLADAIAKTQDHDSQASILLHDARSAEDQFLLAKVERRLGDADAAIEAYRQATLLAPKDAEIRKEYGAYLGQLGQTDQARVELKKSYALNPSDQETAAALRRVGVVPGPSLKDESDMARPIIPVGPLPELQLPQQQQQNAAQPGQTTAANPRD